jgi:hypothetical protein
MDLDDILNDALDEVTKDEESLRPKQDKSDDVQSALSSAAATTAKTQDASAQAAASAEPTGEDAELANLLKMFGAGSDFEKVLDEAFKDLDLNDLMSKLGVSGEPGNEDAEMKKLMEMLASGGAGGLPGGPEGAAGAGAGMDPKMLEEIASKLESSMGGDQMDKMLQSMMKGLMSKELMYEPIKAITEQYPKFLAQKNISQADRSRFEAQFSAYSALKKVFEEDENNTEKVMQIIQDLERFGQPPEEISKILGAGAPAMSQLPGGGGGAPGMPNPNQCPTQ